MNYNVVRVIIIWIFQLDCSDLKIVFYTNALLPAQVLMMNEIYEALKRNCQSTTIRATIAQFEACAKDAKQLKVFGNNDQLLLYSLYKQSTVGDVNTAKPSVLNPVATAKW